MGGTNPYIKTPEIEHPKKPFKITFSGIKTITIEPSQIPFGETGLPGSILDIALNNGVGMDHACGGVCACATCHVVVKQGLESCNGPTENELDMLDLAPDLRPESRLGCQCVPNGEADLVVEIPSWNRNLVREGK